MNIFWVRIKLLIYLVIFIITWIIVLNVMI
jgi:hypothetical protein